jgi:hypothetical protein
MDGCFGNSTQEEDAGKQGGPYFSVHDEVILKVSYRITDKNLTIRRAYMLKRKRAGARFTKIILIVF